MRGRWQTAAVYLLLIVLAFSLAYAAGVTIQNRDLTITGGNLILSDITSCTFLGTDSSGNVICSGGSAGNVSGTGTANYIVKWTGTSTVGNSQIYDDGTNVGIGTTSPTYKLDVSGDIRATGQVIAGDLVFKNGFRFVEDGNDALALLNPDGEVILRIDYHGNLWVRGEIRGE